MLYFMSRSSPSAQGQFYIHVHVLMHIKHPVQAKVDFIISNSTNNHTQSALILAIHVCIQIICSVCGLCYLHAMLKERNTHIDLMFTLISKSVAI